MTSSPFVVEELMLVAIILGGIAVMVVGLVRYQRGKESRLAAQTDIELPIESTARTLLVLLPAIAVGPVLVGVLGVLTDPWMRAHAFGATTASVGIGALGLFFGLRFSRGFPAWARCGTPPHGSSSSSMASATTSRSTLPTRLTRPSPSAPATPCFKSCSSRRGVNLGTGSPRKLPAPDPTVR